MKDNKILDAIPPKPTETSEHKKIQDGITTNSATPPPPPKPVIK